MITRPHSCRACDIKRAAGSGRGRGAARGDLALLRQAAALLVRDAQGSREKPNDVPSSRSGVSPLLACQVQQGREGHRRDEVTRSPLR